MTIKERKKERDEEDKVIDELIPFDSFIHSILKIKRKGVDTGKVHLTYECYLKFSGALEYSVLAENLKSEMEENEFGKKYKVYKSKSIIKNSADRVIASAEAVLTSQEKFWATNPEHTRISTVQTRASVKALRACLTNIIERYIERHKDHSLYFKTKGISFIGEEEMPKESYPHEEERPTTSTPRLDKFQYKKPQSKKDDGVTVRIFKDKLVVLEKHLATVNEKAMPLDEAVKARVSDIRKMAPSIENTYSLDKAIKYFKKMLDDRANPTSKQNEAKSLTEEAEVILKENFGNEK